MTVKLASFGRSALFSPCNTWRYSLRRHWTTGGHGRMCAVLINPSRADASRDDSTTTWMMRWAAAHGYCHYEAVNLFAVVGTDPRTLLTHPNPIGPDNDEAIRDAAGYADRIVVAWGSLSFLPPNHRLRARVWKVLKLLADRDLYCFGTTKGGWPRFPRCLGSHVELKRWRLP